MAAQSETVRSANSGLASSEPRTLAEVDRLLARVPVALTDALGDTLIGVYLFGSLVRDFEPEASDIDIAAAIATDLDLPTFDRLLAMHGQLERAEPRWLNRIEVVYLTAAQLARFDPATTIAVISPGEPFHRR
jgi:predicted nucleotidyltransferase